MSNDTMLSTAKLRNDDQPYITAGQATIAQEIKGLQAVSEALDGRFVKAVELIASIKGKLIVSGMGKSGHIGRKIAATLASTGTPALFVHPGEASHGDLGMIGNDDALLMLSNSGETSELEDMIAYAKRFSIPMVSLTRREDSKLIQMSDIGIALPDVAEASPIGAPTTSAIMMLAYGDALAMALLEKRGFTKEDFRVLHPGGKLGKGLLKVKDLMHTGATLPLVKPDENMKHALVTITSKSFGCAAVVDSEGKLVGIITDGDLRRHMEENILTKDAASVMTRNPKTIHAEALAVEAVNVMNEKSITSLFVIEAGRPVGLIHIHDCLRAGVV
ncbi:MAG: KpsF/GutQ family sugar-phosphate isomerase [Rickettsiales bacterium]